jgi:hypothetical protein
VVERIFDYTFEVSKFLVEVIIILNDFFELNVFV